METIRETGQKYIPSKQKYQAKKTPQKHPSAVPKPFYSGSFFKKIRSNRPTSNTHNLERHVTKPGSIAWQCPIKRQHLAKSCDDFPRGFVEWRSCYLLETMDESCEKLAELECDLRIMIYKELFVPDVFFEQPLSVLWFAIFEKISSFGGVAAVEFFSRLAV